MQTQGGTVDHQVDGGKNPCQLRRRQSHRSKFRSRKDRPEIFHQLLAPHAGPVGDADPDGTGLSQSHQSGPGRPAGTEQQHSTANRQKSQVFSQGSQQARRIGIETGQESIPVDNGVDGADPGGEGIQRIQIRQDLFLVGDGHVDTPQIQGPQALDGAGQFLATHPERQVDGIDAGPLQRGVLHHRRQGMPDGIAEDPQNAGFAGDVHGQSLCPRPQSRYSWYWISRAAASISRPRAISLLMARLSCSSSAKRISSRNRSTK